LISIIFWLAAIIICVGYGGYRVYNLYVLTNIDNAKYLRNGFILIMYSVLTVGVASFLNAALSKWMLDQPSVSMFWIAIVSATDLLKYLAPFVFAAIGVNMISYAITNKQNNSNSTSEGAFKYQVDGLSDPSWPQKYNNPVNVGDHISVDYAYKDTSCAARVTHVEHTSQGSHLIVKSIEKELEKTT
jgi:hypothetical protein